MRIFLFSSLMAILLSITVYGQNVPVFSADSTLYLINGSGENQFLLSEITDGDNLEQSVEIGAIAVDTNLVKVISVEYHSVYHYAIIQLMEKGISGATSLVISASDSDGTATDTVSVTVGSYRQTGMVFEIHDAVFWQEVVPLKSTPVFSTIIASGQGPYNSLDYSQIPLTVSQDCGSSPPCTGHDFFTSFYRGYFIPPVSGAYSFTMMSQDNVGLWLSTDANPDHAQKLIFKGTSQTQVGTQSGSETTSAPVDLIAGKVYAFYATQWIIHSTFGGILLTGPGISKDYLPGKYTLPVYDPIRPLAPTEVSFKGVSESGALVSWNNGTDNLKVTGYNFYLDGKKINPFLIPGNSFQVENLKSDSTYAVMITSLDKMGNESLMGSPVYLRTYPGDSIPPGPPTSLTTLSATGQAIRIKWSGATDHETAVIGYHVYLNGGKINPTGIIYDDSLTLQGLDPVTTYKLWITSVDAGFNESQPSDTFDIATTIFDPLGPSLGEKRVRLSIQMENISWNEGLGLNGPYEDGSMVNDSQVRQLISNFQPGTIRWGAISANSKSLGGSSGTGKVNTYAQMLNFANQLGSYFSLTVGVQDGIDYRTDLNTFSNLLEYLAGPSTTTWGSKRAAEGFTEPLLQKGKGILLEFGNEVWGAGAHNAQIGSDYAAYGNWCREAATVIRNSPYYDPEKIIMVYSGRNPSPLESYGLNNTVLTGDTGQINCLAVSGYLGGNLNYDPDIPAGVTEGEYYRYRIAQAANNITGLQQTMQDMITLTGTVKSFYLYEANATNPSYNGRLGQAIVMTDYLAASMKYGSIVPSIFHLTGGEWRISVPSEGYKPLPFYETGRYFNRFCKGNVLKTLLETNDKIIDGAGNQLNFDPVGAFASNMDTVFSIALFSRDFDHDYSVQIDLPDDYTFRSKATKYVLSGTDFSTRLVTIDSSQVNLEDSMLINVPKFSMVLLTFNGENPNLKKKELGYFSRIQPSSVTIIPETDSNIFINRQKLYFLVDVKPDNAFSKSISWQISPNSLKPLITPSATRITVKGSGACTGNGNLMISAIARDNKYARADYNLSISSQGLNCNTGIKNPFSGNSFYYPNPACDQLMVNLSEEDEGLEMIDMTGKVLLKLTQKGVSIIPVKDFENGVYLLKKSGQETITRKLIISH